MSDAVTVRESVGSSGAHRNGLIWVAAGVREYRVMNSP